MPRFVVLEHCLPPGQLRGLHWDLMLEEHGGLRTWALSAEPTSSLEIVAEQLPQHRSEYLEYEGPISGDRGIVRRWDQGSFRWLLDEPQRVEIHVDGQRLTGTAVLQRKPDDDQRWLFAWLADD